TAGDAHGSGHAVLLHLRAALGVEVPGRAPRALAPDVLLVGHTRADVRGSRGSTPRGWAVGRRRRVRHGRGRCRPARLPTVLVERLQAVERGWARAARVDDGVR